MLTADSVQGGPGDMPVEGRPAPATSPSSAVLKPSMATSTVEPAAPRKLTYRELLADQLGAVGGRLGGRVETAYQRLRGQEVLLVTLLCLCCTLLCVFVTHRYGGPVAQGCGTQGGHTEARGHFLILHF